MLDQLSTGTNVSRLWSTDQPLIFLSNFRKLTNHDDVDHGNSPPAWWTEEVSLDRFILLHTFLTITHICPTSIFFFCKLESDHPESNYSSGIKGDTKIRSNPRIFFFISLISLSSYPPLSCLMTWKSISVQYLKWFPKMDRREVWGGSLEDRKHTAVLFLYLLVVLVIYCKTNCIIRHFIQCKCEYIVTNTVMVTSYLGS